MHRDRRIGSGPFYGRFLSLSSVIPSRVYITHCMAGQAWPPYAWLGEGGRAMLWTIFVILLVLWLLGFSLHVAGGLIHLLLVIALAVLIVNLLTGRRAAV